MFLDEFKINTDRVEGWECLNSHSEYERGWRFERLQLWGLHHMSDGGGNSSCRSLSWQLFDGLTGLERGLAVTK